MFRMGGAGDTAAGAEALRTFYLEPEPEMKCFPQAGAVKNFHGSASLTESNEHGHLIVVRRILGTYADA